MSAHTEDPGTNRRCPRNGCDKGSEKKSHLKIHARRHHTQEKPVEGEKLCDYEVGKKTVSTSGALSIHQKSHDEQRRSTGDVEKWKETVQINKNRGKHRKNDHGISSEKGEGKGINCPKCNKMCSEKYALEKHMIKYTVEKNYVCNICGKRLKRQNSLNRHLRLHSGTKDYRC